MTDVLPRIACPLVLAAATFVPACSWIEDHTTTLAGQLIVVAVVAPEAGSLPAQVPTGLFAVAQLAEAKVTTGASEFPVNDAEVQLSADGVSDFVLEPSTDGVYRPVSMDGFDLSWTAGRIHRFEVETDQHQAQAAMPLPDPTDVQIPSVASAGHDLVVPLAQGLYVAAAAVVVDSTGLVTYRSYPDTADEILDLVAGDGISQVIVPAAAFPAASASYAVGIAGLAPAGEEAFDGFNVAVSHFLSGTMVFAPVAIE